MPALGAPPHQRCLTCHRTRDCLKHRRAECPPDATKRYLLKTCPDAGRPCQIVYQAGGILETVFQPLLDKEE
jgi:hypothetical protein